MQDQAPDLATEPVAATRGGDPALEFDLFFERERARLFRALCLVTRNRFEAEELAQDAASVKSSIEGVSPTVRRTGEHRAAVALAEQVHRGSVEVADGVLHLTHAVPSLPP